MKILYCILLENKFNLIQGEITKTDKHFVMIKYINMIFIIHNFSLESSMINQIVWSQHSYLKYKN